MPPRLVLATAEQARERDVLTHAAWGEKLSVSQYLQREQRLRAHRWSRRAMRTWLLVGEAGEAGEAGEGGEVLASCETFRSDSWLRGQQGASFGVASVYTEPALRGRGYASVMMRELAQRLREGGGGEGDAHAVHLYSEVGAGLYERAGYVVRPSFDWVIDARAGEAGVACDALLGDDAEPPPAPDEPFVIWPSADQIDWHVERERAYSELLGRPRPSCRGARAGGAWALWAGDFKGDRLRVLLMMAERADEARALLEAARHVAHEAGLGAVVAWEDDALAPCFPSGEVRRVARPDALPMILPLAPGLEPRAFRRVPRALWV